MKTIVITGNTRGLGFELAKCFRRQGFNIVINGVNEKRMFFRREKQRSTNGSMMLD